MLGRDIPYVAGLFEGEGAVGLADSKGKNGYSRYLTPYPQLHIKMTDLEPLLMVQGALGFGKLNGPYAPPSHKAHYKPYWVLSIYGFEKAQAFTAMVWPWMGPRRRAQLRAVLLAHRGVTL